MGRAVLSQSACQSARGPGVLPGRPGSPGLVVKARLTLMILSTRIDEIAGWVEGREALQALVSSCGGRMMVTGRGCHFRVWRRKWGLSVDEECPFPRGLTPLIGARRDRSSVAGQDRGQGLPSFQVICTCHAVGGRVSWYCTLVGMCFRAYPDTNQPKPITKN